MRVLGAVCLLLGENPTWLVARQLILDDSRHMLSRLEHLDISSVTDKTLHRLKRGTEQKAHSCSLVHVFSLVYNINIRSFFTFQSFLNLSSLVSLLFIFTCFSFIFHLGNLYFCKLFVFLPFVQLFFFSTFFRLTVIEHAGPSFATRHFHALSSPEAAAFAPLCDFVSVSVLSLPCKKSRETDCANFLFPFFSFSSCFFLFQIY